MSAAPLAAVLAGGRSRRMGAPKALALLGGEPLLSRVLATVAAAGLDAVVVAKPGSALPPGLGVPVWEEPEEPVHPLTGLVAALERAGGRAVLALACDMPFVAPGLLTRLAALDAVAACVRAGGRLEPFPGRYAAAALPVLRAALARQGSVRGALEALGPVVVEETELAALGDPATLLTSLNTPEQLAAAEALGWPAG